MKNFKFLLASTVIGATALLVHVEGSDNNFPQIDMKKIESLQKNGTNLSKSSLRWDLCHYVSKCIEVAHAPIMEVADAYFADDKNIKKAKKVLEEAKTVIDKYGLWDGNYVKTSFDDVRKSLKDQNIDYDNVFNGLTGLDVCIQNALHDHFTEEWHEKTGISEDDL